MKRLLFLLLFIVLNISLWAQTDSTGFVTISEEIYNTAEKPAEFEGGQDNFFKFLPSNIKYPPLARDNGVQGKTIVRFVIEKDGSITQIKCLKIYSNSDELAEKYKNKLIKKMGTIEAYQKLLKNCDEALIEESIRVVSIMPKWKPGIRKGEPVRTYFTLPISFKLQ